MRCTEDKILDYGKLLDVCRLAKKKGKKIVSTSGCFDLLHAGHVRYLEEAKAKGDMLILLLNSDASVRSLKGYSRPVVGQQGRAVVAAGLESVDYVYIFEGDTPCGILEKIQPDIIVKGGDYAGKQIPEMDTARKYGGKVEYVLMVDGCSTTKLVEKIRNYIDEQ